MRNYPTTYDVGTLLFIRHVPGETRYFQIGDMFVEFFLLEEKRCWFIQTQIYLLSERASSERRKKSSTVKS